MNKRNGFQVMWKLLKLVKPLAHIMASTITSGVLGFLSAIFIMVLGALGLSQLVLGGDAVNINYIIYGLIALSFLRAILRYTEQLSGHYIAFKLLAIMRDKIFKVLRQLAFVKLENKQAGQLISMLTTDIELLEVFYAHTIAPISIAFITSLILIVIFAFISPLFALIAFMAYLTIGVILPVVSSKSSREDGRIYRHLLGNMTDHLLDSMRGMKEVLLFGQEKQRLTELQDQSEKIDTAFKRIKDHEGKVRRWNEICILGFNILMLLTGISLYQANSISFQGMLVAIVMLMSSYGPVIALSNLSNNLLQTLASGERVLDLLEEKPAISEVTEGINLDQVDQIDVQNIDFAYQEENILSGFNLQAKKGEIIGIHGRSGVGKSTLLKLIMRFFDPQSGDVLLNGHSIKEINTSSLRDQIVYITQSTYIFNETIYENIAMAKRSASEDEIIEAAQKAGIHDFIMSLPNGYQTKVSELGQNLSDGEKQRIGIARAFLYNAPVILLDEPTSNLDSLNEALVLKALMEVKKEKVMILVSHRASTMGICDHVIEMDTGRSS